MIASPSPANVFKSESSDSVFPSTLRAENKLIHNNQRKTKLISLKQHPTIDHPFVAPSPPQTTAVAVAAATPSTGVVAAIASKLTSSASASALNQSSYFSASRYKVKR